MFIVLENQEAVDKMNQVSSNQEIYTIACEYNAGVSQEEFIQALKELKKAGGCIELSEEELDSVAGGNMAPGFTINNVTSATLE